MISPMPTKDQWPQVVLALGLAIVLVTGAVILLALGRSESVILTLAALIAVPALAWFATTTNSKLEQVKELSMDRRDTALENSAKRLVEMNERLLALVAQTHPNIPTDVADKLMPTASIGLDVSPTRTPTWEDVNLKP